MQALFSCVVMNDETGMAQRQGQKNYSEREPSLFRWFEQGCCQEGRVDLVLHGCC